MSVKHPIISVTGSSGAGTSSVKKTFERIFRREKITASYIERDAFQLAPVALLVQVMLAMLAAALREEALSAERWNRLHPFETPRTPLGADESSRLDVLSQATELAGRAGGAARADQPGGAAP